MRFDPSRFPAAANATGFQPDNLERVLRLRELLTEFQKHSFLGGRLILKGGTALNLFYLGLARLSVDIDLNYIAHLEREAMLAERPEIVKAVDQISAGIGYKLQNGTDDHALREWHLGYVNHAGAQDRIQVEINFLMRAYALPPRVLAAAPAIGSPPCEFLVLAAEEVFGGKIKAMIDRRHPRDLYDLFRFAKSGLPHDAEILRKLAVLLCSTMDRDFRTYTSNGFPQWTRKNSTGFCTRCSRPMTGPNLPRCSRPQDLFWRAFWTTPVRKPISLPSLPGNISRSFFFRSIPRLWNGFGCILRCSGKHRTSPSISRNPGNPPSAAVPND